MTTTLDGPRLLSITSLSDTCVEIPYSLIVPKRLTVFADNVDDPPVVFSGRVRFVDARGRSRSETYPGYVRITVGGQGNDFSPSWEAVRLCDRAHGSAGNIKVRYMWN